MIDHLNPFVPYDKAPASHENQLTRALLILLRFCPAAHQAWLNLAAPDEYLYRLPQAKFATQRRQILDAQVEEGESVRGISVWLAPDAEEVDAPVAASDRQQMLDGIVTYGSELVVVVESKVVWGEVTEQPIRINLHENPVIFEGKPRSVSWQALLSTFADLAERQIVSGAERLLIDDFLELANEHFPWLGPYSSLERCGEHADRLRRRLDTVQAEAVGNQEGKGVGWRNLSGTSKITMAWLGLDVERSAVSLRMYPADTLGQARVFYKDRSLYWANNIEVTRELARENWQAYWLELESHRYRRFGSKVCF